MNITANLPLDAEIVDYSRQSSTIFSLNLRLTNREAEREYKFSPGQFNMLYLYGVGEIPISIVSDPAGPAILEHTIREVGRVTRGFAQLKLGDHIGLRGPFGRGWPMDDIVGNDVLVITGGLGCAPVVSVINYINERRADYGKLTILQGVKHSDDLIWRDRYDFWATQPDTEVHLAADVASSHWSGVVGPITQLFDQINVDPKTTRVIMCGPEPMLVASAKRLIQDGFTASDIWLSMERNMQCAIGLCGHCQFGDQFICRDGPIFSYSKIQHLLGQRGF